MPWERFGWAVNMSIVNPVPCVHFRLLSSNAAFTGLSGATLC
jgi:hypothetical protein